MQTFTIPYSSIKCPRAIRPAKSKLEKRIFMFIDMKSSTSFAEQIGTQQYFHLLKDYFESLLGPIADYGGEIYQIVGDEIVVTWSSNKKLHIENPIKCYHRMKKKLKYSEREFTCKYGIAPDFKASVHYGEVLVSNWSFNNKERVFIGDVLNTASRILSYCKQTKRDLLISKAYLSQLPKQKQNFEHMERIIFRGKKHATDIYSYFHNYTASVLRQVS